MEDLFLQDAGGTKVGYREEGLGPVSKMTGRVRWQDTHGSGRRRAMRKISVSLIMMVGLGIGAGAAQAFPVDSPFTVMTQNLYLGADLSPMFTVPPEQIPVAAGTVFGMVQATDFPSRAKTLATEIAAKQPLLIGVQEANLWRTGPPDSLTPSPTPATTVAFDYKQLLLNELAVRGPTTGRWPRSRIPMWSCPPSPRRAWWTCG